MKELNIGDTWTEGNRTIKIVDKDGLCYKVLQPNNFIRTISKDLVNEWYNYIKDRDYKSLNASTVHTALAGKSNIDKFEYGYESTLFMLAKAIIEIGKEPSETLHVKESEVKDSYSIDELAERLSGIFKESIVNGQKSIACLAFGFKYARALTDISCLQLIKLCNEKYMDEDEEISENYNIEMSKGIKLHNVIEQNLFDMTFDDATKSPHPVFNFNDIPLQQIFFGAPGTGKSHGVKVETEEWEKLGRVVRTTFHPDSDYSTFVGAYKPTTEIVPKLGIDNKQIDIDGKLVTEKIISYEFVAQAFLQAYIAAWTNREEPEYLIIEEINRGNCAQIFGDLFQLLDRGDDGYSEYAIKTDKDMQKYLAEKLKDADIDDYPNVKKGTEMVLPCNLILRATMNTSDQSLFPIDSAFKRRWDWKYIPIVNARKNYRIEADGVFFDWWDFVTKINANIAEATSSEDKKLGYFFCKAKDGVINSETFVGKVIFYLYNDVFKDADDPLEAFKTEDGNRMSFDSFYTINYVGLSVANDKAVRSMLEKMSLKSDESEQNNFDSEDKHYSVFYVNGEEVKYINAISSAVIKEYVKLNPQKTASEVYDFWTPFAKCSYKKWVIDNEETRTTRKPSEAEYCTEITCADGKKVWVNKDGWAHYNPKYRDTVKEFIDAVREANIGIEVTEKTSNQ